MRSKPSNMVRKVPETAAHTELAVRVTRTAKLVVNATQHTRTKTVQHLAKNATNMVSKIISVFAADQLGVTAKAKHAREVEHQLTAGAQKDITDPTEVDAPGQDHIQEVDHKYATSTPHKLTGMISMTLVH